MSDEVDDELVRQVFDNRHIHKVFLLNLATIL
jgi:hypothetical protein